MGMSDARRLDLGKHQAAHIPSSVIWSIVLCIAAFAHRAAFATTIVATGATINTNTQWLLADSPYVLQGGLTVSQGVALTIEAGVEVFVADYQSINVLGTLRALGQDLLPVSVSVL